MYINLALCEFFQERRRTDGLGARNAQLWRRSAEPPGKYRNENWRIFFFFFFFYIRFFTGRYEYMREVVVEW